MRVRIEFPPCNSCGLCREVCPESAIRPALLEPRHLYEVQETKCTGCGECLEYCPAPGALVQYQPPLFPPPLAGEGRVGATGTEGDGYGAAIQFDVG